MVYASRFRPRVLLLATLVSAIILVTIVAVPQWLSKGARLDVLRDHVGQIADLAASVVDGDLHAQLIDPAHYSKDLYDRRSNRWCDFIPPIPRSSTSTRWSSVRAARSSCSTPRRRRTCTSVAICERRVHGAVSDPRGVRRRLVAADCDRQTWVTPTFQQDDYGDFLTAHKAIYDGQHRYVGFVGVDFDLQYYLSQEARFGRSARGASSRRSWFR